MSEDMVERVARALAADSASEEMFERGDNKGGWEALARAAIEAMRGPTEAMVTDGALMGEIPENAARETWIAMIDASLNKQGVEG